MKKIARTPEIDALFITLMMYSKAGPVVTDISQDRAERATAVTLAKLEKLGLDREQVNVLYPEWQTEMRGRFRTGNPLPTDTVNLFFRRLAPNSAALPLKVEFDDHLLHSLSRTNP